MLGRMSAASDDVTLWKLGSPFQWPVAAMLDLQLNFFQTRCRHEGWPSNSGDLLVWWNMLQMEANIFAKVLLQKDNRWSGLVRSCPDLLFDYDFQE